MRRWGRRAGIFLTLWAIYAANGRELGSGDTAATSYLAVALVYGDGPVLDRFVSTARPPYWAVERGGHLVSLYPLLPALLAAPVVAPQVLGLELRGPGWDATAASTWWSYRARCLKTIWRRTAAGC